MVGGFVECLAAALSAGAVCSALNGQQWEADLSALDLLSLMSKSQLANIAKDPSWCEDCLGSGIWQPWDLWGLGS